MVLWDYKLVIELPPGCSVFLPSALIRHSNTSLQDDGDFRCSLAQYTASGCFRWVEEGSQTHESFSNGITKEEYVEAEALKDLCQFQEGLQLEARDRQWGEFLNRNG